MAGCHGTKEPALAACVFESYHEVYHAHAIVNFALSIRLSACQYNMSFHTL